MAGIKGRGGVSGALAIGLLWLAGCLPAAGGEDAVAVSATPVASRPVAAGGDPLRIVVFGDSLTAGLGLPQEEAYPARLQERIDRAGYRGEVVSAGVSGETTAGGLRRIDWTLEGGADILVLALGGNDALRGLPVEQMRDNLAQMIAAGLDSGAQVLLAGMEAPPNFGLDYAAGFRAVFAELAADYDVPLLPFLLDGVAGVRALNQPDGIHPNAAGAERVAANVWSALEPLLRSAQPAHTTGAR